MEFFYNKDILKNLAADAVSLAIKNGAHAAEADISESYGIEVEVRGGAMDGADMSREQGLSVTIYVNGGSGTATTGELSPSGIKTVVDKALTIARASAADPHAGLADKADLATEFPDLSLYHPWDITTDNAFTLACECEKAAWEASNTICRDKSEAAVSTSATQGAYANSHGFCAAESFTSHAIACSAIAEADGQMERDGWSETRRFFKHLPSPADIGKKAGDDAARRLGNKKIGNRRANVLFLPPSSHTLIYHIISAASGGALYHKTSWLAGKLNTAICAPHLSINERPHLPSEMRSAAFDGDGVATHERAIIKDGVWQGCFLSAYNARRLGMSNTGNAGGAHNLEVSGNIVAIDELMKMLGTGLMVTDLMGQGVNPVTGDYSRGAAGFWVENSEIVHPVSEITLAGNIMSMLESIPAIGDDIIRRGLARCGSILVPDLMIGGA